LITLSFQIRYAKNTNKCVKWMEYVKVGNCSGCVPTALSGFCLLDTLICVLRIP
jgi:hypothetical protein